MNLINYNKALMNLFTILIMREFIKAWIITPPDEVYKQGTFPNINIEEVA